jgi:hypothetical protein
VSLLPPAALEQHLARLRKQGLPAAVAGADDTVAAAAAAAEREGPSAAPALELLGGDGAWAHLSQEPALEAALLVTLDIAGQKSHLLSRLGRGVDTAFVRM